MQVVFHGTVFHEKLNCPALDCQWLNLVKNSFRFDYLIWKLIRAVNMSSLDSLQLPAYLKFDCW